MNHGMLSMAETSDIPRDVLQGDCINSTCASPRFGTANDRISNFIAGLPHLPPVFV